MKKEGNSTIEKLRYKSEKEGESEREKGKIMKLCTVKGKTKEPVQDGR